MRMADAELLPFQFGDFADTIKTYLDELKKLATDQRAQIEEQNKELDEGARRGRRGSEKDVCSSVEGNRSRRTLPLLLWRTRRICSLPARRSTIRHGRKQSPAICKR